jgi:hypothetical protein
MLLFAIALCLAPHPSSAQPQLGPTELGRAKTLVDLYKAQLSAEQYSLLSTRLAQTEQAYLELTAATGEATAAAETGAAAEVAATGGRAILSGISEVLPLLLFVMPSTAHAPGMKEEKAEVRAARAKVEESLKELARAARQVEAERNAAALRRPRPQTSPRSTEGVTCTLVASGGGFTAKRPRKCEYHCSNGLSLCKLVRAFGKSCPAGTPTLSWFPISELDGLEDCP